jgi:Tol biopolymer transport system component
LRVYHFDSATSTTVSEHVLAPGDEAPMAWSPDGKRIALIEATGGGRLRIFDFETGVLLDSPSVPATAVDWSSHNELAIVAPNDQSDPDVYALKPDSNDKTLLVARDGVEDGPAWSPDGRTVAFWNAPSVQISQRTLLAVTNGDKPAKDLGPGTDVAWSNDGQLAYSRPSTPGTTGARDIYTSRLADAQPARLTQSITLDRWPSWSPANDAVAYLAQVDPSTAFLCLAKLATQANLCLDLPGLQPGAPAWSPF